jgi:hypothetical protein
MAKLAANIEEQIDRAMAEARDPYDYEVAVLAEFDRRNALLLVKSGQRLAVAQEDLQDLADADAELVSKVEIEMLGTCLHWEELDVDFGLDGLRQGRYGAEWWMDGLAERRRGRLGRAS